MDEPLSPLTMGILLALAAGDQHGYGLMQEIEGQTGRRPGTGSLYAALGRLTEDGLIEESPRQPGPEEDQRRQYYRITVEGTVRARGEAARMLRVLETARERSLVPNVPVLGDAR